jgi:hypothetical protein
MSTPLMWEAVAVGMTAPKTSIGMTMRSMERRKLSTMGA